MVRFTTTISLPPECLDFVQDFHAKGGRKNGKKSFSAWVSWCIKHRKHLGIERALDAEKSMDRWYWIAQRMEVKRESIQIALKAVGTFHETCWSNRESWGSKEKWEHMMMDMPPVRSDDIPLEGEEE